MINLQAKKDENLNDSKKNLQDTVKIELMNKVNNRMKDEVNLNVKANNKNIKEINENNLPPTKKDIFGKLHSQIKNSNNLNKCYNINEDVIKSIPAKNKTIANDLFEKLDFDFIKEKNNKNGIQFNEDYYRNVKNLNKIFLY